MIKLRQHPDKDVLTLSQPPKRIVSLVPSVTESLIAFGIMPVGRSSFCIEPKGVVNSIDRVGGTKTPNLSRIIALQPDLVIANQEENTKEHVQAMRDQGLTVWVTFPNTIKETHDLLCELASLRGIERNDHLHLQRFATFAASKYKHLDKKVLVMIWKDPWMAVGQQTYTHHLLQFVGADNAVKQKRYPEVSVEDVREMAPDVIILPTEPYAFGAEDIAFWQRCIPDALVMRFSGEDLFWSGMRAIDACTRLAKNLRQDHGEDPQDCL